MLTIVPGTSQFTLILPDVVDSCEWVPPILNWLKVPNTYSSVGTLMLNSQQHTLTTVPRAKWRFPKKLEEEDIPRPLFAALERYEAVKNNGTIRFNLHQEAKPLALRAITPHAQ